MDDGLYRIMSGLSEHGNQLYLGAGAAVTDAPGIFAPLNLVFAWVQTTNVADDSSLWKLTGIPGTAGFYLTLQKPDLLQGPVPEAKHNNPSLSFSDEGLKIRPLDTLSNDFVLYVDDVGEGQVALNDCYHVTVADVREGDSTPGTEVINYAWNGGDNQRWRFHAE